MSNDNTSSQSPVIREKKFRKFQEFDEWLKSKYPDKDVNEDIDDNEAFKLYREWKREYNNKLNALI